MTWMSSQVLNLKIDTISPDIDGCGHGEPVAMPSESSADSLTSPSDSYSDDSAESLSSFDHDCSLDDESTSYSELSDEEREPEESQCVPKMLFPGAQLSNHDFSVALLSIFQKQSHLLCCGYLKIISLCPACSKCVAYFTAYATQGIYFLQFPHNYPSLLWFMLPILSSGTLRCPRKESNVKEATFVEVMIDAQLKERFMGKTLS